VSSGFEPLLLDVGDSGWAGVESLRGLGLGQVFGLAKALQALGLPGGWFFAGEGWVYLAGYGPFEATHDFSFAFAFSGFALDVLACSFVVSHRASRQSS